MIYKKPKVIVLIPNFLPGFKLGGPLTSVINILDNLSEEFCFEILTSDRDMGDNKPFDKIICNIWHDKETYKVCYLSTNVFLLFRLIMKINSSKADILYLNSLFNPIFSVFIVFAKKFGLLSTNRIILAPRGETFDEALEFKKMKKSIYIKLSQKMGIYKHIDWHASTEIEKQSIIKNIDVDPNRIRVALNLTQKKITCEPEVNNIVQVRDNNYLHVVFLSRISKDKNILYTFDILKEIKTNVIFDIYGPIEDDIIWDECMRKIIKLPHNILVKYNGPVAKDYVKTILREYDLMFLPTFAENFGHVIVESLSVGTPVLISDNTPWRNLESQGYGWDLPLDNPKLFIRAIEFMSNLSIEDKIKTRNKIKLSFLEILNNPDTLDANRRLFE
jgi:glycosyltransferase involved in cell wall biosynthesis